MYLLNLSHSQHPDIVAPHVASHGAWVKQHIDNGNFLLAGPKRNRLGGVALARSMARADLLALIAQDSYVQADVAQYEIVDFACKLAADGLSALLET